jgi:hypothetical protein
MWITVKDSKSTEIENNVFRSILEMYPEESLGSRIVFREAFASGQIEFSVLKNESEKILIPWQMFFLNSTNLRIQITNIEKQRKFKVSPKLIARRKGAGNVTSKRIIDRLIRQQNFLLSTLKFPKNGFCGELKGLRNSEAVEKILSYFKINRSNFWDFSTKRKALEYLVEKIESKNINVSKGVLAHKLLPNWKVVPNNIYKNTSGFVIKDERVPFVFLPNELNPDELEGRQIYTLIYLMTIIGLEQYDYFLDKNLSLKEVEGGGVVAKLHDITSGLLIPSSEVEQFRDEQITLKERDSLTSRLKVSPTALLITLLKRSIISRKQYEALKPSPYVPQKNDKDKKHSPKVSTSIRKFCGQITYQAISDAITSGALQSIQAQHLIWGAPNKKAYRAFRSEIGV